MAIVKSTFTRNYYIAFAGKYFCGFSNNLPVWGDWNDSKPFASIEEARCQSYLLSRQARLI